MHIAHVLIGRREKISPIIDVRSSDSQHNNIHSSRAPATAGMSATEVHQKQKEQQQYQERQQHLGTWQQLGKRQHKEGRHHYQERQNIRNVINSRKISTTERWCRPQQLCRQLKDDGGSKDDDATGMMLATTGRSMKSTYAQLQREIRQNQKSF